MPPRFTAPRGLKKIAAVEEREQIYQEKQTFLFQGTRPTCELSVQW